MQGEKKEVQVALSVLESARLTSQEFQTHLQNVAKYMKKSAKFVIPSQINDLGNICMIVNLSKQFDLLCGCEGFEKHIRNYAPTTVKSNLFVTELAALLKPHCDVLVLEPEVPSKKCADIYVKKGEEELYIECKTIETKISAYAKEHGVVAEFMRRRVITPHQLTLTYKHALDEETLARIVDQINQRLPFITSSGKIIDTEEIEVDVVVQKEYAPDLGLVFIMEGISETVVDGGRYPMHIYSRKGTSIAIAGPQPDYGKPIMKKIEKSRSQHSDDAPFILAINANDLLGSKTSNLRSISNAFQPQINTRFSGILLLGIHLSLQSMQNSIQKDLVVNPYARLPLGKELLAIINQLS